MQIPDGRPTQQLSSDGESFSVQATVADRQPTPVEHPERSASLEKIPEGGLAGLRKAKMSSEFSLSPPALPSAIRARWLSLMSHCA